MRGLIQINFNVSPETYQKILNDCDTKGVKRTIICRQIIEDYYKERE